MNLAIQSRLNRCQRIGYFVGSLFLAFTLIASSAGAENEPQTLKETFKEHFPVGVAINRSHATGLSTGKRTLDQIGQEVALIQTHFNQITAENDMKWKRIHPREGPEGYDFVPADALVEFGENHGHEIMGHTLVWHNQTPDWVFAGKVPPPQSTTPTERVAPGQMKPVYEEVFRAIMKHRNSVKLVTFWGVNDAVSWLRAGSHLLFDGENKPKPAFDAVIPVANEAPKVSHDLTPLHDATRVLENPHKGWYHHFPDNNPNKYQIARDADLLEFPGMDHLYIRLAWAYLEPKEGQFDWPVIDSIIEKWTSHGLGIAFRISCKETSTDRIEQQYATPFWVKEAGATGGHYKMGNPVGPDAPWEPIYDDPVFLAKLENFLAAFAARYDGKPWVRYVDIGSIGDWGEGHSWASSRKVLSFAVRKAHIDLHLKYFKRSQLMISDDYVHALADHAERETLHRYILDNGISYRDDSILVDGNFSGSGETFTVRSPEYFAASYPLRPTVLELEHYGKVKSLGNWDARPGSAAFKSGEKKSGADHLRGALGLLHASYIGYHGDAREWLTDNPDLTNELLNRCGYWLFPMSLDLPSKMVAGSAAPLRLAIENRGVAPPYHPYELRLKLAQGDITWEGAIGKADQSWLPGKPLLIQSQLILPADLKPGHYTVALGLFDESRPVEFALSNGCRESNGYYRVAGIEVKARE